MSVVGPGAYPRGPVTMRQASNTGDPWAADFEHSPQFMEAVRNGANIGELRRQSVQNMLMEAGTAELSPVIYETPQWCGKDGCRPATPCPSCAGHRKPVVDDSAATEAPRQRSIEHRQWSDFPDHAPAPPPSGREPDYVTARQKAAALPTRQPEGGQVLKGLGGFDMDYDDDDDATRRAYLADEVARIQLEHGGMFALSSSRKPSYGTAVAEPEVTLADLSEDDLDGAMAEVAEWRGISLTDVAEQVDVLAGGQRDTYSRIVALAELAALDEDTALTLTVSAEKRDELADRGKGFALPDGSYPIHDAKHLGTAKAFFKQGKLAGHSAAEVRAHINKAAARLGLPGLDDDGDDDTEDATDREAERRPRKPRGEPAHPAKSGHATRPVRVVRRGQVLAAEGGGPEGGEGPSGGGGAAMSARRVAVRTAQGYHTLALTDDQAGELGLAGDALSPVDRIARRNPEYFELARSFYNEVPSAFEGDPEVLLKKPGFDVHEITDEDPTDPDGGDVDKIIARLQRDHNQYFSPSKAYGSVTTHRR